MLKEEAGSRLVARAAVMMSMTDNRDDERALKEQLAQKRVAAAAVDYGGEFVPSIVRIVERAVVAAKREGVIGDSPHEEGAVAGAAREAVSQVTNKALGFSVGGKIGLARTEGHVAVAVFLGIGLVHLNEICIGMGHRAI